MDAWVWAACLAVALAGLACNAALDLRGLVLSRRHFLGARPASRPDLKPLSLVVPVGPAARPSPPAARPGPPAPAGPQPPGASGGDDPSTALAALAGQDYPQPLEVIFCLEEGDEATWEMLEKAGALRPATGRPAGPLGVNTRPAAPLAVTARLVARGRGQPESGGPGGETLLVVVASPRHPTRTGKGNNLAAGVAASSHPWVAWMDADVEPGPGFLQELAAPLAKPGVGCSFAFPFHRGATGPWAAALALFVNVRGCTDFVPLARAGRRPTFLAGAAVAVRREVLNAVGGPEALWGRLADDIRLGELLGRHGWRACPIDRPAWCRSGAIGARRFRSRLRRWLVGARFQVPGLHAASALRLGALWAMACLGLGAGGGWPAAGIAAALAWAALRVGVAWGAGVILGEASTRRWCFLAPAVDLAWAAAWAGSWFGRHVDWAGLRYRLGRGGIVERVAAGAGRGAKRRAGA